MKKEYEKNMKNSKQWLTWTPSPPPNCFQNIDSQVNAPSGKRLQIFLLRNWRAQKKRRPHGRNSLHLVTLQQAYSFRPLYTKLLAGFYDLVLKHEWRVKSLQVFDGRLRPGEILEHWSTKEHNYDISEY